MLVYICDDECRDITRLQKIIERVSERKQIPITLFSYDSAETLLAAFEEQEEKPDIIFSDIEMGDMDGIDLGKRLALFAGETVFVLLTAFAEYAIRGYETRAYRYLLKPVSEEDVSVILEDIYRERYLSKMITLNQGTQEIHLEMRKIRYICSEDKYSIIHTTDGTILDRNSLNYFEEQTDGNTFFRIHRKYLVNLRFHKGFKGGRIILDNNEEIPVSRRKKTDYQAYLCKLLEGDLLR